MNFTHFIGIDIGKEQLEVVVLSSTELLEATTLSNQAGSIRTWVSALPRRLGLEAAQTLVCLEHTGLYGYPILTQLHTQGFFVWLESAVQIQQSQGLQRGKTDRLDAERIARYAQRFADQARAWQPPREVIQRLEALLTLRERLLKTKTQLFVPLEEARQFMAPAVFAELEKHSAQPLADLQRAVAQVEKAIQELLRSDDDTREQLQRLTSIDGVGPVTAATVIAETNEFKTFTPAQAKQFACHCGVVPFERSSGSSLRRRPHVHARAHKRLKTLLHLCARAAVRIPGEFQTYYERKIAQGKHRMSVLNAIRNKLVLRIFAIIRNSSMYQKNYHLS